MKYCGHLFNWSHQEAESEKVIGQSICQWQVSFTQELIVQHARAVLLNKYGLCFCHWLHDTSFFTTEWAFSVIDKSTEVFTCGANEITGEGVLFSRLWTNTNMYLSKRRQSTSFRYSTQGHMKKICYNHNLFVFGLIKRNSIIALIVFRWTHLDFASYKRQCTVKL